MQYEGMKSPKEGAGRSEHLSSKYSASAPGYVLLPQAPLARDDEFIDASNANNPSSLVALERIT